jgi:hypothetical protein
VIRVAHPGFRGAPRSPINHSSDALPRLPCPPIEQPVYLFHGPTERAQLRLTAADLLEGPPLGGAEPAPYVRMAVLEQIADLLLDRRLASGSACGRCGVKSTIVSVIRTPS